MTVEFIKEDVDIYQLPEVDSKHLGLKGTQITIGDLHANPIKLMFMLIKHGIAKNITEQEYSKLVQIYKTPTKKLTRGHIDEFNKILSKMEFKNDSLIRLIGDELSDRGNNDYFILKIFEQLNKHKVPVETLISNHGIEFVEAYETSTIFHSPMLCQGNHSPSMEKMQMLVDEGIVTRKELLKIAKNAYKPTLRAISYSLSEDKNEITLYSHAAIGMKAIEYLAMKLNVPYKDTTAEDLAKTIDEINTLFQKHVQNNTVHTLYDRAQLSEGYADGFIYPQNAPLEYIMWNRTYVERPRTHSDYKINFVHGHDSNDPTEDNLYNLDNQLGKVEELNKGSYTVLFSPPGEKTKTIKPIELEALNLESTFFQRLKKIDSKELSLRNRGHIAAANHAQILYNTIKENCNSLSNQAMTSEEFTNSCLTAIKLSRPKLEEFRGCKQILGNLGLAVLGAGIFYVAAGLINLAITGNFLFFKTDSAEKIDKLQETIESMAVKN